MPLFPEQNLCFIHIPKTGGVSIEFHFFDKEKPTLNEKDKDYIEKYMIDSFWKPDSSFSKYSYQHFTYNDLKNKIKDIDKYKIFTIIRNPYDRLVSEFHYRSGYDRNYIGLKEEFKLFVKNFLREGVNNFTDNHQLQQYKFIENFCNIYIIRFETLEKDFEELFGEEITMNIMMKKLKN